MTPRGPRRHGESIQVAFRKRLQAPNLSPPCPEVTVHLKIERLKLKLDAKHAFTADIFAVSRFVPFIVCVCVSTLLMSLSMEACPQRAALVSIRHSAVLCDHLML